MRVKCFGSLAKLFAVAVVAVVSIVPAQAQVAWVQQSIYGFKVKNNTNATADQFQVKLRGVDMWALDQQQCVSPNYSQCHVTEDWNRNELTLTWSQGSTAVGQNASFAIVVNHYVSLQGCDMIWADANGQALGHIDDVWQDWTTSGSGVYGTIHNRTTGTRYVRRAVGYASTATSLLEMSALDMPPNAIVLDPIGVSAIEAGSSSTYDYSPYYLADRSTFMFYEVYADSGATSPLISFGTAAVTTIPAGGISFASNVSIEDDHIISPPTELPYDMISARAVADSYEDLQLDWIVVNGDNDSGSPADVTVKIWKDINNDGKVVATVDQLLGSAVLSAGSNQATVQLTPSVTIPRGSELSIVVTYTLPASVPVGSVLGASIGDACAIGSSTGIRVPKTGDSISGASIVITPPPTTIGDAKKLPVDPTSGATEIVWLKDMVVTAFFGDIVYIEDENRTSGIGVLLDDVDEAFQEGMQVSVMGRVTLDDGVEAVLDPIEGVIGDMVTPLAPLMMTNKSAGGGVFGIQPAVIDNAYTNTPATGLNNVGRLVKICGQVTGTASFEDGDGEMINIAWIDDGSGLRDGVAEHNGVAVFMPRDWTGTPLAGMVVATGIIRAQASPEGRVIRVLFPRSMSDIQQSLPDVF